MKTIYILRHGSSHEALDKIADKDRRLTKNGKLEIGYVAKKTIQAAEYPDLIVSSDALRAVETANIFAKEINYPENKIQILPMLYESKNPLDVLQFIESVSENFTSLCLVGHNPLLEEFLEILLPDSGLDVVKGELISISCDSNLWDKIKESNKKINFKVSLKSKTGIPGQISESISDELFELIHNYFSQKHEEVMKHMEKAIQKTSRELSRKFTKVLEKKTVKIRKTTPWAKD
jgi:phosphohistidine phosphatase